MSLTAAQLFANVGLTGAASTVAGLKGVGAQVNATHTGMGRLGGAATSLKNNFLGMGKAVALGLGIGGITSVVGGLEQGISKANAWGLAIEKLGTLTSDTTQQLSGLLGLTEKYGVTDQQLTTIVGATEKTLGKLEMTTVKGTKAAKSAALQSLETQKLHLQEVGAKTTLISKLISEQTARDALTAAAGKGAGSMNKLQALQKLYGVTLSDSKGQALGFTAVLLNIADAYTKAHTAAEKAKVDALASSVLLKGYAVMAPILRLGKQGIVDAEAEAAALGLTLTAANVVALSSFREQSRQASDALSGLELQLGLLVMPDLTVALKAFVGYIGGHQGDIKQMFSDGLHTAEAFVSVITGTVIPAIQGIVGVASGIWNKLPDPLKQLLVGGIVANKLTGGAVKGLGGDLVKGVLGIGGRAVGGAAGGALAGLGATHVWVDNMGAGGMGGGAGGAAGGAGAAGAGAIGNGGAMLTGAGVVAGAALSVGAVAAVAGVAIDQYNQISGQGDKIAAQAVQFANASTTTLDMLKVGRDAVIAGAKQLADQAGYNPLAAAGEAGLNAAWKTLNDAINAKTQGLTNATRAGERGDVNPLVPTQAQNNAFRKGERDTVTSHTLSSQITAAMKGIKLGATAADLAHSIRSAFQESTGPSQKSMTSAMEQLKQMQARYLASGDTVLAASIGGDIRDLKSRMDTNTAVLRAKNFSPKITVNPAPISLTMDGRQVQSGLVRFSTNTRYAV